MPKGCKTLQSNTHVHVLGWLHRPSLALLASEPARGVFGLRSPARPNPTGLSAAKLLRLEGRMLYLDRLDVVRDLKGQPQDIVVKSFGQEVMNSVILL
jgi:tRNA (Thr-GGU) A37 N-methylase